MDEHNEEILNDQAVDINGDILEGEDDFNNIIDETTTDTDTPEIL